MAYLALARKWRPKSFSEVVGQAHVVKALSNGLDSGRVHHAYLFTGTRGVGKTTLARIFAKSLNCETGTSAEPCQQCSTCLSVDEGRFVDLIEVDAASRTKVDDTRELLENVQYAPTSGKYKVYLIDEVHMLSGHSFNALLKTLEEPPEHVKFLFATTDPQKLPVTVLSRCLQFNLRAMRPEQVENQMVKILDAEGIPYDSNALQALAKAADGSMRDGLSLLDQAIAQSSDTSTNRVTQPDVEAMLGTVRAEHSDALLEAIATKDADKVMAVVADMADHAVDFISALDELLVRFYNISLLQVAPSAAAVKGLNESKMQEFADAMSPELVQLYYQIGLHGKKDIALAPSLRIGFELALLRMLVFEPGSAASSAQTSSAQTHSVQAKSNKAVSSRDSSAAEPEKNQDIHTKTIPQVRDSAPDMPRIETNPKPESQIHTPPISKPSIEPAPLSEAQTASAPVSSQTTENNAALAEQNQIIKNHVSDKVPATQDRVIDDVPSPNAAALAGENEWGVIVEQSALQGLSKQLAMNCACERLGDEKVDLVLAPNVKHLFKEERRLDIETEISRVLKAQLVVEIFFEDSDKETPAECLQRLGAERHTEAKNQLEQDPGIKALISEFDATIVEQSIKPAD